MGLFIGMLTGNFISSMQPLNFICNYYGEKMAFFFAFQVFYTSWLIIPALPGIALFIYQMSVIIDQHNNGLPLNVDTPYTTLYCLIMAVWSTLLIEVWKRRQNEIAHLWNMKGHKRDDQIRPDFRADLIIDSESRSVKSTNVVHTKTRRIFGEIPIVSISIAAVIACFSGNIVFDRSNTDPSNSVIASIINAVVIIVLDAIYRKLATMMANWENHRYADDYESSLISKNFAFTFVNSNIALFSIAFYEQDFNKLT